MTQKATFEEEITCFHAGTVVYSQHFSHPLVHYPDEYSFRALSAFAPAVVNIALHLTIQEV